MINFTKIHTPAQIEACHNLACEIWQEYYCPIIAPAQVDYMLKYMQSVEAIKNQIDKKGYLYYLVYVDEILIGYFALSPKTDEIFLSKVYLKADTRGQGFGQKTFEYIRKVAKELGFKQITLTVNKSNFKAIQFYERNDFKNLGSVVQDIGGGYVMDDFKFALEI